MRFVRAFRFYSKECCKSVTFKPLMSVNYYRCYVMVIDLVILEPLSSLKGYQIHELLSKMLYTFYVVIVMLQYGNITSDIYCTI